MIISTERKKGIKNTRKKHRKATKTYQKSVKIFEQRHDNVS